MTDLDKRIEAIAARQGVELPETYVPIKQGNKSNVVAGSNGYLGQRFPVTLYAPSWLSLLRSGNIEAIVGFIEANEDVLSWGN
jgi:hypothetical protein